MKILFVIYADTESLLKKIQTCDNNPENSLASKITKHTASGYSLLTHCSDDFSKSKQEYYREEHCMKNVYKDLRGRSTKTINCEKLKMKPLT